MVGRCPSPGLGGGRFGPPSSTLPVGPDQPQGGGFPHAQKGQLLPFVLSADFFGNLDNFPPPKSPKCHFWSILGGKIFVLPLRTGPKILHFGATGEEGGCPPAHPLLDRRGGTPHVPFYRTEGFACLVQPAAQDSVPQGLKPAVSYLFHLLWGAATVFFFFWQTFGYSPVNGQTVAQQLPSLFPCCLNCHPC